MPGNAQLDAARTRPPVPVAGTFALRPKVCAILARTSTGPGADVKLHRPRRRLSAHLAKQVGIGNLFHERAQVHHGFGPRLSSLVQVGGRNPTLPENPMTTQSDTTFGDFICKCENGMRLDRPTRDHAVTADGSASLRFEAVVPGRDGGSLYRLEVVAPDKAGIDLVVKVLVRSETTFSAARQAGNEGLDFDAMSLKDQSDYLHSHSEKFGHSFSVKEFRIERTNAREIDLDFLIDSFVKLVFFLNSSFELNRKEGGVGYYPDEVIFQPCEIAKQYHRRFCAGGG